MARARTNGNGNCDFSYQSNGYHGLDRADFYGESTPNGRSSGNLSQFVSSPGLNCIVHPVSKFDTLAGVAIKYGVEVADIKKLNGLVTDLQMFALKSLQIPLPGRHPPSPSLLNDSNIGQSSSETTTSQCLPSDFFESFHSLKVKPHKVSPAMSTLQGYYGLKPYDHSNTYGGCEIAVYRKGASHYLEDGPISGTSQHSDLQMHHHRKSKSLINGFSSEKGELAGVQSAEAGDGDSKSNEKLIRRRQKSVADFSNSPELLLKDDINGSNGFSSSAGKGLAQRPKASGRADAEGGLFPVGLGDSFVADGFSAVRKSSSTSSLLDQENGSISSIWSTSKWSLKPDLQAISSASRPIFDGLPKPITGRRNKAALD